MEAENGWQEGRREDRTFTFSFLTSARPPSLLSSRCRAWECARACECGGRGAPFCEECEGVEGAHLMLELLLEITPLERLIRRRAAPDKVPTRGRGKAESELAVVSSHQICCTQAEAKAHMWYAQKPHNAQPMTVQKIPIAMMML